MFVKGTVELARRQQHAGGVAAALLARRHAGQCFQQLFRIGLNRRHLHLIKQFRHQFQHHFAVFQHVGHAGRGAGVIFQHIEIVAAGAHQIDAGDMHPHAARRGAAHHVQAIGRVHQHQFRRDQAGLQYVLRAIDIGQEHVERLHPLLQALFQPGPFRAGDDARHDVERDQSLRGLRVSINSKGDADAAEEQFGLGASGGHEFGRAVGQPLADGAVGVRHPCRRATVIAFAGAEHLVKGRYGLHCAPE